MARDASNKESSGESFGEEMSPERLVDAAEAALKAVVDVAEHTQGKWMYPADLMGSPLQPEILKEFTLHEIEQASEFLVRLGIIERKHGPARK
jgi:hypothetical protein